MAGTFAPSRSGIGLGPVDRRHACRSLPMFQPQITATPHLELPEHLDEVLLHGADRGVDLARDLLTSFCHATSSTVRAFFSAAAPARCAGDSSLPRLDRRRGTTSDSARSWTGPRVHHHTLDPRRQRPGSQPSARPVPLAPNRSLCSPSMTRTGAARTRSGPCPDQPRQKAAPTTVSPGQGGCSCCTPSRRRTSSCRTRRRNWASSRRQKRAPDQAFHLTGALPGMHLSHGVKYRVTPDMSHCYLTSDQLFRGISGPRPGSCVLCTAVLPLPPSHRLLDQAVGMVPRLG